MKEARGTRRKSGLLPTIFFATIFGNLVGTYIFNKFVLDDHWSATAQFFIKIFIAVAVINLIISLFERIRKYFET